MHLKACLLRALAIGGMCAAVPLPVLAQNHDAALAEASEQAMPPAPVLTRNYDSSEWNHFGVDFRMGFNIKAKFSSVDFANAAAPAGPAAGSGVNRTYADGFVDVDSSGNAGGRTWNWGYQNASQVVGDTLLMHAASVSSAGSESSDNAPLPGFEVSYVRDLKHGDGERWGIKAAFGYMEMNMSSSGALSPSEQIITDTYQLHGITPPVAPYSGSFGGPGAVIGSSPTRSTGPGTATITGTRSMDATLYDFRLGPTLDLDITRHLSVELGSGVALGVVDSTFAYHETASATSMGSTSSSGSTSDVSCQGGVYVEAALAYQVCRAASLFGGVEFQDLGTYDQSLAGHTAQLDLSQSLFVVLGVEIHF